MGVKKLFFLLFLILLVIKISYAQQCPAGTYFDGDECVFQQDPVPHKDTVFAPPLYIADPKTLECKYYFSGDKRHFNPRNENFTVDIGLTTDFKSLEQACDVYKCYKTSGTILMKNNTILEKDLCKCPENTYWDDLKGCVKIQQQKPMTFLEAIINWIKKLFGLNAS